MNPLPAATSTHKEKNNMLVGMIWPALSQVSAGYTVFNKMCKKSIREHYISKGATTTLRSTPLLCVHTWWANHILAPDAANNTQTWWAKCVLTPQTKWSSLYAFLREKQEAKHSELANKITTNSKKTLK